MKSILPFKRKTLSQLGNSRRVTVYFPPDLEEKLVKMSRAEHRSLSGQIVHLLSKVVETDENDRFRRLE